MSWDYITSEKFNDGDFIVSKNGKGVLDLSVENDRSCDTQSIWLACADSVPEMVAHITNLKHRLDELAKSLVKAAQ